MESLIHNSINETDDKYRKKLTKYLARKIYQNHLFHNITKFKILLSYKRSQQPLIPNPDWVVVDRGFRRWNASSWTSSKTAPCNRQKQTDILYGGTRAALRYSVFATESFIHRPHPRHQRVDLGTGVGAWAMIKPVYSRLHTIGISLVMWGTISIFISSWQRVQSPRSRPLRSQALKEKKNRSQRKTGKRIILVLLRKW